MSDVEFINMEYLTDNKNAFSLVERHGIPVLTAEGNIVITHGL